MSDVSTFRANLGPRSLSKTSRFQVLIFGSQVTDAQPDLRFMAHEVGLPGREFEASTYRFYGPHYQGIDHELFDDLSMSFYTKDEMTEFIFINEWMEKMAGHGSGDMDWIGNYSAQIMIEKLSEVNNDVMLRMICHQAFPLNIQTVPLSWSDDSVFNISVRFTYHHYTIHSTTGESSHGTVAQGEPGHDTTPPEHH